MKAVAYQIPGAIDREDSLQDISLERPKAAGRDLLVRVKAISVNPVDTKVRKKATLDTGEWKVLGFDAAGIIEEIGPNVQNFQVGDEVFYAGSIARPGTNSEYHLVDERIVGNKPKTLNNAEAAALPLTAITAWEMLFDRLEVHRPTVQGGKSILIIGGAGGVGSVAIQLLRACTELTVIATASRPETQDWVKECGAHHVINHCQPMAKQIEELGLEAPGFVFSTTHTDDHLTEIFKLIAPQGRFGLIDDPQSFDILPFKRKAISIHWELMFTRSLFETPDMAAQGELLNEVARLVDASKIHSTMTEVMGKINAVNLRAAHTQIESGSTRGKIVLEGF